MFFLCALIVPSTRRSAAALALTLVVAVWCAVGVRGWIGSTAWDERSLLFRSHYAQTALEVGAAEPLLGVGPAGFQAAYMVQRPDESPEEVSSPHMAVLDWLVGVGVSGIGVGAVLLAMLAWAAAAAVSSIPDRAASAATTSKQMAFRWVAVSLGAALAMSLLFEAIALPPDAIVWRVGGAAAAMLVAWACTNMAAQDSKAVVAALAAGALVVVVHGQLDMGLVAQSTACWAIALLALAAASGAPEQSSGGAVPLWSRIGAVVPVAVAAAIGAFILPAALSQERGIEIAAQHITSQTPDATNPDATSPTPAQLAQGRMKAAAQLAQVWRKPQRTVLAAIAAEQFNYAAVETDDSQLAAEASRSAVRIATEALVANHNSPVRGRLLVAQAAAVERLALLGVVPVGDAITAFEAAALADPRNTLLCMRLAGARRRGGDGAGEQAALRRAIECDDSYRLDPLRQLPPAARAALEERRN